MISRHGFVVIASNGHIATDGFDHPDGAGLPGTCREAGIEHMQWANTCLTPPFLHRSLRGDTLRTLQDSFDAGLPGLPRPDWFVVVGPDRSVGCTHTMATIAPARRALVVGVDRAMEPPYLHQTCSADLDHATWDALAAEFETEIPADIREWREWYGD